MNPIARYLRYLYQNLTNSDSTEERWRQVLTGTHPLLVRGRIVFKRIPSDPRCQLCKAPFRGLGAPFMRMIGKAPSRLNPLFCKNCLDDAPLGGAEIELTMLFADVRGSTTLAEKMKPIEYSQLIDRFFSTATEVLIKTGALIDRLVGDQVIALYLPGFAGPDHASRAFAGAQDLLLATGHLDVNGPWIPVGIGLHTDVAFVGKVGQAGVTDLTVLGDGANVAARLASLAQAGEMLISAATYMSARLADYELESRMLELKGRSEPLEVWTRRIDPVLSPAAT